MNNRRYWLNSIITCFNLYVAFTNIFLRYTIINKNINNLYQNVAKLLENMYANFQIFMISREIIVKKIKSSTKNYLKKKIACQKNLFSKNLYNNYI